LVLALAACVHATETFYVPTEGEPRLNSNELRDQSDAVLRVECQRLADSSRSAGGEAILRLTLDRSGSVQRAQVVRSSGDSQIDALFGGLAAQLQLDPAPPMRGESMVVRMNMGYSCGPGSAVTTITLLGG
jgi:TonB family protein